MIPKFPFVSTAPVYVSPFNVILTNSPASTPEVVPVIVNSFWCSSIFNTSFEISFNVILGAVKSTLKF